MASKPRSEWTPAYRRRIESAERRGLVGAAKRGHKPAEHITRAQRQREAGKLTESDKRWLKSQQKRIGYDRTSPEGRQRWAAAVKAFEALTPEERFNIKAMQKDREKNTYYADLYAPMYGAELTPLYLSSRSGLR